MGETIAYKRELQQSQKYGHIVQRSDARQWDNFNTIQCTKDLLTI